MRRCPLPDSSDFYPRPPRGGRHVAQPMLCAAIKISIHALREEGDPATYTRLYSLSHFYPRPPRGGRPPSPVTSPTSAKFLSTPSARRATRARSYACRCDTISIHALREEGDLTSAARDMGDSMISIHALREEGDPSLCHSQKPFCDFYPRPPRGGRPVEGNKPEE